MRTHGRIIMTRVVVIGGTGLIGSKVVARLAEHGHEAIAASPKSGVNTLTGEGLAEVLAGAQVVVDVSNSPSFEDEAALDFLTTSTRTSSPPRRQLVWAIMSGCPSSARNVCRRAATSERRWRRRI
jgi:NAD(P)-dependent dehydrogenase (short-subunit alcohol dehydrogenase family)